MLKLPHFAAFFIFFLSQADAQRKPIYGFLEDSITHFPIIAGNLTNGSTNKGTVTGDNGSFRIDAAPNDLFFIAAKSYLPDTVRYSFIFQDTVIIYLSPAGNILPEVTVTTRYTKYQLDSIERKADFEAALGNKVRTLSSSHESGFGLTFNLDPLFKKKYRDLKKKEQLFADTEKRSYVDYRFSPHLVAYYTGFKGDSLRHFMNLYTPAYQWLRSHTSNEDLLYYVNDRLKIYNASRKS